MKGYLRDFIKKGYCIWRDTYLKEKQEALEKKLDDREADLINAKKEGREEVFVYLENDAPELAQSIRQTLKGDSHN